MSSTKTKRDRSTARKGDPRNASRGAAVDRARKALGDAIAVRVNLDVESLFMAALAKVIGCKPEQADERVKNGTLDELDAWTKQVVTSNGGLERIAEPGERTQAA